MRRYVLTLILLGLSVAAWAQDNARQDQDETGESQESAETAPDAEADDLDLDEENYLDAEEEDFVPTEDIPADQAIPFPTDI